MSANRKLLAEIQQVLKKVEEGIQVFDEIWEKVYAAEQQSLKEKYESDLKKEIKKLQRLRDQIKTWIGGNDIKDKTQLIEARKSIETKMEQFKVCEKDTKTKAYSKEGLARDVKQDPKDILRGEKRGWVNECIDKLNDLINSVEVEREKLLGGKGSKKAKEQQLERIENRIQKHKWHIVRLELIIKLLDSEDLDPSNLEVIEDSLEYYLESAVDDDGALGVEDEFDIYEELELESLGAADATFDIASHAANAPTKDESEAPIKQVETVATPAIDSHADAATSNKGKKGSTSVTGSSTTVKVAASPAATAAVISGKSVSNKASSSSVPAAGKTSKQQQKDAQVAVEDSAAPTKKSGTALKTAAAATAADATSETKPTAVTGTPMSWATAAGNAPAPTASNAAEAVASSNAAGTNTNLPPAPEKPSPSTSMPAASATVAAVESAEGAKGKTVTSQASALAPSTAGIATTAVTVVAQTGKSIHVPERMAPPTANSATPGAGAETFSAPPAGSTVLSSQPSVVTRSLPTMPTPAPDGLALPQPPPLQQLNPEMMTALGHLKQSMLHSPESLELDKQSRNFYAHSHSSFPTTPLFGAHSETAALFEKLPMDTLFFVFYFQQGTYQQYLAAKQLKKHSWRFHKKYMTWFQRHEEPKVATEEFEEGTYVYFDYETGWCQRIKQEFKFEYAYLEDELGGPGEA